MVAWIRFEPERRRCGVDPGRAEGARAEAAPGMNEVTRILSESEPGDPRAAERLLPLVYDELRRLSAARLANERADHTLDATAPVHEAYLSLVGDQQFEGRSHFFASAAEAMRRVLVDQSRNRARLKRGGG
jgi:RNA polymerase sigma factor (TIGR02999 family)